MEQSFRIIVNIEAARFDDRADGELTMDSPESALSDVECDRDRLFFQTGAMDTF